MNLSPEIYVNKFIKGKSREEALSELGRLVSENDRLKRLIREHPLSEVVLEQPGPDMTIAMNKVCIRKAREYFKEQGWEYEPSADELADILFNEKLTSLKSLTLAIGGFFTGQELQMVIIDEDKLISNHSVKGPDGSLNNGDDHSSFPTDLSPDRFITELQKLHIGEWEETYFDPCVLDGTTWELELKFTDRKKIKFDGQNKYPWNFRDFMNLIGMSYYHL